HWGGRCPAERRKREKRRGGGQERRNPSGPAGAGGRRAPPSRSSSLRCSKALTLTLRRERLLEGSICWPPAPVDKAPNLVAGRSTHSACAGRSCHADGGRGSNQSA